MSELISFSIFMAVPHDPSFFRKLMYKSELPYPSSFSQSQIIKLSSGAIKGCAIKVPDSNTFPVSIRPTSRYGRPFLTTVATLQWQNIDMGLLDTNEQRITTFREGEFFTTTNYVYEVDIVLLNLSYTFSNGKDKSKFIDSEFGKKEF